MSQSTAAGGPGLARQMGLLSLAATGICSMMGAAINVVPFMIQRNVPGIGPHVLPAFLFGALPALLAAFAYAILASAMPRAGGSYIYASRSLHPYLGFVASFSQWFGLSIAIGVVSYVIVPFLRDIADALGWAGLTEALGQEPVRLAVALAFLWIFVGVNIRGLRIYEKTLLPLMFLMFAFGSVVIFVGFTASPEAFGESLMARDGVAVPESPSSPWDWSLFLAAAAILFSSFIGFDSIAQAGGEAKNPSRNLPLAIGIAFVSVGTFYFLFTAAVYRVVPWAYIAQEAQVRDLTAPGLLGYLLPTGWTVLIVAGAAIALINDLPAMLLAVSRLMFAWAEDGIFPRFAAKIHPVWQTPIPAIIASGAMATTSIIGCSVAGDFFLGVDLLVTSMLVNFLIMCLSVLWLPRKNPSLAQDVAVVKSRPLQVLLAGGGTVLLAAFLVIHVAKDLSADLEAWYFHSTPVWLLVMALASTVYAFKMRELKNSGTDVDELFSRLPEE